MALDAESNLYVTNDKANRVAKFNINGVLINNDFLPGVSRPFDIVIDQAGDIYVCNIGGSETDPDPPIPDPARGIRKYDSDGNFLGTVTNESSCWVFDLTADESTFYFTVSTGVAYCVPETCTIKTVSNGLPGTLGADFASGLVLGWGLRILPDGGVLVSDQVDIKRFDSSGAVIQTYDIPGAPPALGWYSVALDPDGPSFWAGDYSSLPEGGILSRFDLASGALLQQIDVSCSQCLFGLAVFGVVVPVPVFGPHDLAPLLLLAGLVIVGALVLVGRVRSTERRIQ